MILILKSDVANINGQSSGTKENMLFSKKGILPEIGHRPKLFPWKKLSSKDATLDCSVLSIAGLT